MYHKLIQFVVFEMKESTAFKKIIRNLDKMKLYLCNWYLLPKSKRIRMYLDAYGTTLMYTKRSKTN